MIKVHGIKNCDSVKKAIKFFKNNNLEYMLRNFKEDAVSQDEINKWLKQTDTKTLFNSKSTTYRNLKLKELDLDDDGKAKWLAKENLLIKRPVIEYGSQLIVGFNEDNYKGIFL